MRIRFTDPAEKQKSITKLRQLTYKKDTARYITKVLNLNTMAKLSGRPLREIIKRAFPEKIIELITINQEGEPDNDNDDAYFNALRKTGRHYDKYSARKRNESSIPTATHKSKAKNKPRKKEIGNKRPRNNTNLQEKETEKPKPKRRWPSMHAALQGINQSSIDKKKKSRTQYWRYSRNNHYTLDYFANTSLNGKVLPPAPGTITSIPAQKEKPVPETTSSGVISAAMVAANKATGLNPVKDPSVPKDYTLSVPIFQEESSSSDNDYTGSGAPY